MPPIIFKPQRVLEIVCGILLIVPAAVRFMPLLTPLAAAVLLLETVALRIRFLLTSRPRFFRGDVEVPRSEALKLR